MLTSGPMRLIVHVQAFKLMMIILRGDLCFRVGGDLIFYKESMKLLKLNT